MNGSANDAVNNTVPRLTAKMGTLSLAALSPVDG